MATWQRDPIDRHYRERLAASTFASLVLHAILAALLFSVLLNTSQEGANENVSGGEVVTLERRAPIAAQQPSTPVAAPALPHAPRIAPLHNAPLAQPQTQKLPQNQHELARQAPTAPPNPKPVPQRSFEPNPQPTQNIYEVKPSAQLPAAPVSIPTVAPIAVAIKVPPTAAPSPAPSARPTAQPSPRPPSPTAPPSTKPATPAPPVPNASPTAAAVAVHASALPSASPAPAPRTSQPPAPKPGVASPSPTSAPAAANAPGSAPSPGPKGIGSPGPHPGPASSARPSAARPVQVPATPTPVPKPTATPRAIPDINAKLRAMLPSGPVTPGSKQYAPQLSLHGRLEPTPPPEVLAKTKYLYEAPPGGSERRVVMWVTSIRKAGPTTICTGWLVRYPLTGTAPVPPVAQHVNDIPPANGTQASVGGAAGSGYGAPIVEGITTMACEGRRLVPYAGSTAPSP